MRYRFSVVAAVLLAAMIASACRIERRDLYGETSEQAAIADSLQRLVQEAYDFSQPDVVDRLLALYPDTGRVVSASGGRVIASRDSLDAAIRAFWAAVGQNMRDPRTEWPSFHVDVPSTRAAVVTAEYRVPHTTPAGAPHTIGGAMTLVFEKQGARWVVIQEHLSDLPEPAAP
jgi:ketosteroid isomerase-like protein